MRKLIIAPNHILSHKVKKVPVINKKIRDIVFDMEETLIAQTNPQGVGLAAPQIGLDLAIFLIKPEIDSDTEVFINPIILEQKKDAQSGDSPERDPVSADSPDSPSARSEEHLRERKEKQDPTKKASRKSRDIHLEGCLSIPHIWGPVTRADKILVSYQDLTGEQHTKWFDGFKSIIIQHEMDHLNGTLFTQRVLEQKGKLYEEKDGELTRIDN